MANTETPYTNAEGYADPTAYEGIKNITDTERKCN